MKTEILLAERSRAEQALKESEQRFRRLLAASTDYIYTVPLRNGDASANYHGPGCETVTGYSPEEFQKDPFLWYHIIYQDDVPAVLAQIVRILHDQKTQPLEHRIVHKDRSIRWIRNTTIPHRNPEGKLVAYDGLITDVTERKLAEIALQESRDQLALVIQGSNDGIWDWNILTGNVYYSPRWKSMLGYEESELENRFETWEKLLHPEDRQSALATVNNCISSQAGNFQLEHRLRHKDGGYRWILARAVVLRDAQGRAIRMAGSHVDLTDRKLVAETLQRANQDLARRKEVLNRVLFRMHQEHRELQEAQDQLMLEHQRLKDAQERLIQTAKLELTGTLAAGVAHQVKNPLMTISASGYILEQSIPQEKRSPEVTEALEGIKEAVARAATIIDDLLTLSSPTRVQKQPENLNALLDHSVELLKQSLHKARVRVERRFAPDLPQVLLEPVRIEGVFLSLLQNSIQAMHDGGTITLTTRQMSVADEETSSHGLLRRFQPGDRVVVTEIKDTGPGVPSELQKKVFEAFVTTKPPGVGSGLGLTIAKNVIEEHGGAIDLSNAASGGAIATVVLNANGGQNHESLQNTDPDSG